MVKFYRFFCMALILISSGRLYAQDAETVVNSYIEAIGGYGAIKEISSYSYNFNSLKTKTGKNVISKHYKIRPGLWRIENTGSGSVTVYNNGSAWKAKNDNGSGKLQNVKDYPPPFVKALGRDADFDRLWGAFVGYKEKGIRIEYLRTEEKLFHILKMTWPDGADCDLYFNKNSHLLDKKKTKRLTSEISGYKKVGKLLISHKTVSTAVMPDGSSRKDVDTVSDIKLNIDIDPVLFAKPEIKE